MEATTQELVIIKPTVTNGIFILEYPDGRRVLVEINPVTRKERFIREL